MKMVAASKLKRAKDASARTQPYINKLNEILCRLSSCLDNINNPLLDNREVKHTRYLVITSDRGLCGGFNNNLLKYFKRRIAECETEYDVCTIGKKANDVIKKLDCGVTKYYEETAANPVFPEAQLIAQEASSDFLTGKTDRVVLIYNKFVSSLTQRPMELPLLPYSAPLPDEENSEDKKDKESDKGKGNNADEKDNQNVDYLFEPDKEPLLNELLPKQISIRVFQALLDNAIGEHAARMTAMDSATNNANDLISTLTVQMNRARQAAITTELTEIISGAEAL